MKQQNDNEFMDALAKVVVQVVEETVILNREGVGYEGILSYTSGLTPLLGYELVAFGTYDPQDLRASAQLIKAGYPRGLAVPIDTIILKEVHEDIPEANYRQYVVDESSLESDKEEITDAPVWVAEGGYPILSDGEMSLRLREAFEGDEKARHERMELGRQQYRAQIEEQGFTIIPIFDPSGEKPNFAYTVGLTHKGLPELIVGGQLDLQLLAQILHHMAHLSIEEGHALRVLPHVFDLTAEPEEGTKITTNHGLRVVDVDPVYAQDRYLIQAAPILKEMVPRVSWVQISDGKGLYFGQEGFTDILNQPDIAPVIAQ